MSESHETNESVNPKIGEFNYERNLEKFIIKRNVHQNFQNFKFTRKVKGLGKFNDLIYLHELSQTSWCQLFQINYSEDASKPITYEDLAETKNCDFFLPESFESFFQIWDNLQDPNFIYGSKLERLYICTNASFADDLHSITKILEPNRDIFSGFGSLYSLEMAEDDRKKIFEENMILIERLADELVLFIMTDDTIDVNIMEKNKGPNLLIYYQDALAQKVFNVPKKMFSSTFLSLSRLSDSGLDQFGRCLFKNLNDFCQKYDVFPEEEFSLAFGGKANNVKENIKKYKEKENPEDFLKEIKTNIFDGFGEQKPSNIFNESGSLYKLEISKDVRKEIFKYNYMTLNERLADEIISFIMKDNPIDVNIMKKNNDPSLLISYQVALAQKVFDVPKKKFSFAFLSSRQLDDSGLNQFRRYLFKNLDDFCQKYDSLPDEKLSKEFGVKVASNMKENIRKYKGKKSPEEFLKGVKIKLTEGFGKQKPSDEVKYFKVESRSVSDIDKKIDKFLKLLTFAVRQNENKRILESEMEFEYYIAFDRRMDNWFDREYYYLDPRDKSKIMRNWITKEQIQEKSLDTNAYFQGHEVKLSLLIDDMTLIDPGTLIQLFSGIKPVVGTNEKSEKIPDFYIERSLRRKTRYFDLDTLRLNSTDVFLLSVDGENDFEILKLGSIYVSLKKLESFEISHRFYILEKDFRLIDWNDFVENRAKTLPYIVNIHWVGLTQNKLILFRSFGSTSKIETYIEPDVKENDIHNDGQLILIEGEPGMGKSLLLNNVVKNKLAIQYEENERPTWVMNIILNDHKESLSNLKEPISVDELVSFLSNCENLKDCFSKIVLKHFMCRGHRLFIGLDGLDEVNKEEVNKVLSMVQYLKKFPSIEIWITTRPHLVRNVERNLEVEAWSIKKINEEEQIYIMIEYWNKNLNHLNLSVTRDKLALLAKKLINKFSFDIKVEKTFEEEKECLCKNLILASIFSEIPYLEDNEDEIKYLHNGNIHRDKLRMLESLPSEETEIRLYIEENKDKAMKMFHRMLPFSHVPSFKSFEENEHCPRQLLGIPLHNFIVAVFNSPISERDMKEIPEKCSVTLLFKKLIKEKFKIYLNVKKKLKLGSTLRHTLSKYYEMHEEFAIHLGGLLSPDEIGFLSKDKSFDESKFSIEEMLGIGIVEGTRDNTLYMHKSFVEYLVAKRLVKKSLKAKRKNCFNDLNTVKEILLQPDRKNILYFFDYQICEQSEIHRAILNEESEFENKKLTDEQAKVRDCLGRSSLYYAIKHGKWKTLVPLTFEKFSEKDESFKENEIYLFQYGSHYYRHRHLDLNHKTSIALLRIQKIWPRTQFRRNIYFYSLPLIFDSFNKDQTDKTRLENHELDWFYTRAEKELLLFFINVWIRFCVETPPDQYLSSFLSHITKLWKSILTNLRGMERNWDIIPYLDFSLVLIQESLSSSISCFVHEYDSLASLRNKLKLCKVDSAKRRAIDDAVKTLMKFQNQSSEPNPHNVVEITMCNILKNFGFYYSI